MAHPKRRALQPHSLSKPDSIAPTRFRPAIIALEFARATGIKHRSRLIAVPVCGPGCAPRCSATGTTRSGPSRPCAAARAPPTLPPRRRARPRRPPCFSRLRANPPHTVLLRTPFPVHGFRTFRQPNLRGDGVLLDQPVSRRPRKRPSPFLQLLHRPERRHRFLRPPRASWAKARLRLRRRPKEWA